MHPIYFFKRFVSSFLLIILFIWGLSSNSVTFAQQDTKIDSLRSILNQWKDKLSNEPRNANYMVQMARVYFELEKHDSSETWLNLAEKIDNKNPETYFWKGRIFLDKGKMRIIPVEKLLALIKQDNNSKAIKNFEKAIQHKSDYLDAYYYLGIAHVKKGGNSHFQDAIEAYQFINGLNDDFSDTGFQLGLAFHKSKQYDEAFKAFNVYYNKHPEDSRPFIELSRLFLEKGETEKASRYFMEGVVKLRNAEMLDELFLEIQDIVTPDEKGEIESLVLNKKGNFFKKFWKSRDPTPLTEENERFTEHFRRVQFARETYSAIIPPHYDDRGRVYVKYGKPDDRYVSSSVDGIGVKDNESWSYQQTIREGLVFDFVQIGNMYQLVQDLTSAAPTGSGYDTRLALAGQMYYNRSVDLGGVYNRFAIDFKQSDLHDFINEKTAAEQNAPHEVYQFDYKAEPLPFIVRLAQFKGNDEKTWLDIYRGVAVKNLDFQSNDFNQYESKITTSIVIFDSLFNELEKKVYPSDLTFDTEEQIQQAISIDQTSTELPPDNYQIAIQVENEDGTKLGIQKLNFRVREFNHDSLQISDLELATKIEPTEEPDQFYKDGLRVVPYMFNQHSLNSPLQLYYEIYNLKLNNEGNSKYQIDYKITLIQRKESGFKKFFRSLGSIFGKGQQPTVATSYTREGQKMNEKEYISLDIKKMPTGINELSVIVKDLLTNETTSSKLMLELVKPKGEQTL